MGQERDKVRDPVCAMWVNPEQNHIEFEGLHFAFCSSQCRERFLANPHLYIGTPGSRAPKQRGEQLLRRRRLRLSTPLSDNEATTLSMAIGKMMGVKHIAVAGDTVEITYDLLEATEAQIEARIRQAGATLGERWPDRLQRAFVNYLEETQLDSLETQSGHGRHHH